MRALWLLLLLLGCSTGKEDTGTAADTDTDTDADSDTDTDADTDADTDSDTDTDGGGLSESAFAEQFTEAYCDAWYACVTTDEACPLEDPQVADTGAPCEWDPVAAQSCMDAGFECQSFGNGLYYPMPASVCAEVCG